jgi:dTDP-4-dehydrorhamnose 3,5-epimerase
MTDSEYGKLIDGVEIHPLKVFKDERGVVMRMLRNDDDYFYSGFGEVYFSVVDTHMVKAWHLHKEITLRYACVAGRIQLALYDTRVGSPTKGMVNTLHLEGWPDFADYNLVIIPPGVWNGFRSVVRQIGDNAIVGEAIVANCANGPHDPDEIERVHPGQFDLRYDWGPYLVAG